MTATHGTWRPGRWLAPLFGTLIVLAALAPGTALAHPLDEYPQLSYITVRPAEIVVELNLTPGVLLAPQVLGEIDADGDGEIADAEGRAYLDRVVGRLDLRVDGQRLPLTVTDAEVPPYLNLQAGYGLMRIDTVAPLPAGISGTHRISYANTFAPTGAVYQVNAFVEQGDAITLGRQNRDDTQRTMMVDFAIGGPLSAAEPDTTPGETPDGVTGHAERLLAYLDGPALSPLALLLALALAVVLGGLHALTPGHGKTLVAAYLVGSRGTARHALALGGIVTFAHTASVVAIGLLALFASRFVVPDVLVPALQIISGVLVVALGARLAGQRWAAFRRRGKTGPVRSAALAHHHGDGRVHTHLPPAEGVSIGGLVAMGVSGGLVPCPEALGIMILAIGLDRIGLGLGLIVAFSVGLAAVLIAIGVLLVRSRGLVERLGGLGGDLGNRWNRALPLAGAAIVTVLGIGMTLDGLKGSGALSAVEGSAATLAGTGLVGLLAGVGLAMVLPSLRGRVLVPAGSTLATSPLVTPGLLPPRYRDGRPVSAAPMGSAPLVYDDAGRVAWDRIWGHDDADQPFCDLALAGGPPHRGTLLEAPAAEAALADRAALERVRAELSRGLRMVTGLDVTTDVAPGWIGLVCDDPAVAEWLVMAITAERVAARQDGAVVLLPAGPSFRLEAEIRNVVTAVAKTYHYWTEHAMTAR